MNEKPIRGATFGDLTHEDRLRLLQRLQSGAPIWAPRQSRLRIQPIVKKGDASPEGKAAARRRKQMLRNQQAQLARGFEQLDGMLKPMDLQVVRDGTHEVYAGLRLEHVIDGDAGPVSPEVAYAAGLAPGKTWNSMPIVVDEAGEVPERVWNEGLIP